MSRVNHKMSAMEMMYAISGGTPGTISVLAGILNSYKQIDPENSLGIFAYLLTMDSFKLYDGALWGIHSRISEMSILKTISVLRGLQLGIITVSQLNKLIKSDLESLDFLVLISKIRSLIGNDFAKDFEM